MTGTVSDTADDSKCVHVALTFTDRTVKLPAVCGVNKSAPYSATGGGAGATITITVA